ncbi:MAG TPA: serine/threonine-protein kinase [Nannocystaceae bacterium]|nr:serine/threonine-protein kinase [Nannocystaceae bacterium]
MSTPRPGSATAKDPPRDDGPSPTLLDATLDAEVHGLPLSPHEGALVRGTIVGRYVVVSRLGAGGMGVVYGAYDPELERRVALKLLHTDLAASDVSEGRRRLLREAQALAKLSHPNVVAVHDVGTLGTRVWLAMEFVEGRTLGAWRKDTHRGWREVIDTLRPAGEGLAAAHAVGLVHRDFKPDNVMVSDAGRVRVMDFGLARSGGARAADDDSQSGVQSPTEQNDHELSQAGTVIGTPPYMAPEQHLGLPADARSDQFAFCVTLWECLWGQRPFAGETVASVASAIIHGELREPPRGLDVPTWLRRICQRGLAADPAHRFASMGELLGALEHGRRQTQRRRWIVGLAAGAAVPVAIYGWSALAERRRVDACEELGDAITQVWPGPHDELRTSSRASFDATGLPYAVDAAARTHAELDARAKGWRVARMESCLDPNELSARADECLDAHRLELAALVDRIAHVDVAMVPIATQAVLALPRVESCRDPRHLAHRPALPEGEHEVIEDARTQLATAAALGRAGNYDAALLAAREGLALAESAEWAPLVADARRRVGNALQSLAQYDAAEEMFVRAYLDASAADAHPIAAEAALGLMDVAAHRDDVARGEVWGYAAEVAITLAEDGHAGPRWAAVLASRSTIALAKGEHTRARELAEEALAQRESLFGADSSEASEARDQLGAVLYAMGDFPGARALYERTLASDEAALGPEHPLVATRLSNLGVIEHEMGDLAGARELHERALAIRERSLGADHLEVAHSLQNLGNTFGAMGDYARATPLRERALAIAEASVGKDHSLVAAILTDIALDRLNSGDLAGAREHAERSLAIGEQTLGAEHPSMVTIIVNLANVETAEGKNAAAAKLLVRALALAEQRLGTKHPLVGAIENNLGTALFREGDVAGAERHYLRALELWQGTLGDDHPNVAYPLTGLGDISLARGDAKDAKVRFERALVLREAARAPAGDVADARLGLARARFELGLDSVAVARTEVERAREEFARVDNREGVALADAWLAAH